MEQEIIKTLKRIERENDITILYACESGSRAWGFDNMESDYDIRFIYKRNDFKDYLTLTDNNEVIDFFEGDLDIVGWDIKKALLLHYKSNPNLREWTISPIKYMGFKLDIFRDLPDFDNATLKYHYFNIARNNWKRLWDVNLDVTKKDIKMYLYNCRSILTCMAIDEKINPSINIFDLLGQLDSGINDNIYELIHYYKGGCQGDFDIRQINEWMGNMLYDLGESFPKKDKNRDLKAYDERFYEIVVSDMRQV